MIPSKNSIIKSSFTFLRHLLSNIIYHSKMSQSQIPSLNSLHSGVPERLAKEADAARARLYSIRTLPESKPRGKPVRLPPNITQDGFDTAINALVKTLGEKGVELNDKELKDGWYMEHP